MEQILRLDMGRKEARKEEVSEEYRLMGGRGLSAMILNKEIDPLCHPLGGGNKLVVAPGLLAGTLAPSFGRISMGGKSPLTLGIKEANAGGTAAQKMDRLGIKAIVVEGKAEKGESSIVRISQDGCEFLPANGLAGKRNYDLVGELQEKFGKAISVISIGPCGEMGMGAASIAVTDQEDRPSRHAGRGGLGAVMGSKGLKAIVIDDSGTSRPDLRDTEAFQKTVKGLVETLKSDKGSPSMTSALGTPGIISFVTSLGSMPTRNYREGAFDKAKNIFGETIKEINTKRGGGMHGCMPGCVIKCSVVFHGEDGKHLTSALEYETLSLVGTNLGIADPDGIARIDRLCDELGLDTIETGSALGLIMEAGLLEFGDVEGVLKTMKQIEEGTPLGRIIGQGVVLTAQAFGIDRVPAVLGQALPAHDARVCKPVGVTYATSAMGADHTAGIDYKDSLSREGQVTRSKQAQIFSAVVDSVGYCLLAIPTKAPMMLSTMAELLNARYGSALTGDDVLNIGVKTIKEELAFNKRAGINHNVDYMPEFLKTEPLPPQNAVFDIDREEIESIWKDL